MKQQSKLTKSIEVLIDFERIPTDSKCNNFTRRLMMFCLELNEPFDGEGYH